MSKIKISLLFAFTLPIILSGGSSAAQLEWQAGLKGGANWAKLTGDPVSLWLGDSPDQQLATTVGDFKGGFTGGGFVTVFLNEFFGVQAELIYMPKGGKGTASGQFVYYPENDNPRPAFFDGELSIDLECVEIPVMAVFEFDATDDAKIRIRGLAGTTFSFNVHADAVLTGTAEIEMQDTSTRTEEIDQSQEIGTYVKDFEFGLIFGGAVYWDIGKVDLLIESRWEGGLTSLDNTTLARDIRTNNVNILFGFSYPFGG
jgi:hypothetical protein